MDASTVMVVGAAELHHSRRAVVVATPLDMIARLETGRVSAVVLAATVPRQHELATFLLETYPAVRVEVR